MKISESGNAIFYIFIAVAMLGALSFAVTQSSRSSLQSLTEDRARLFSSEIADYGNVLATATMQLRSRNIRDTQISFENNFVSGYNHAPVQPSANKIFSVDGGGVLYKEPPLEWLDTTQSGQPNYRDWIFSGTANVFGVGTTASGQVSTTELAAFLPYIRQEICLEINDRLGVPNPGGNPPQDIQDAESWNAIPANTKFTGAYEVGFWLGDDATGHELQSKRAGCFEGNGTPPAGTYAFYQVLIGR